MRSPPDLDDLKALARSKGFLAERHASVRADADALHCAAEHLRFRLLLDHGDLPTVSLEVQQALKPFYVLEHKPWTELPYLFGLLDGNEQARLEEDVNELMFLWVAAIEDSLAIAGRGTNGPAGRHTERLTAASAMEICDRALGFVKQKAPWLALRARIARVQRREVNRRDAADGRLFDGEPRAIEAEYSALAAFEWGLLELWAGGRGRSIDWMRRAVHLRRTTTGISSSWPTSWTRTAAPTRPSCITASPRPSSRRIPGSGTAGRSCTAPGGGGPMPARIWSSPWPGCKTAPRSAGS